jgi:predicted NUDIX family NTP pyrophosphohydrolase
MKTSAGILLYRRGETGLEVLIGHMGGPYWEHRDESAWSIPKGEMREGENTLEVAKREFEEELGSPPHAESIRSNSFEMEWPRGSGQLGEFPEIDRAAWLAPAEAREKLIPAQAPFLDRLESAVGSST